jgi:hypothetical protein
MNTKVYRVKAQACGLSQAEEMVNVPYRAWLRATLKAEKT